MSCLERQSFSFLSRTFHSHFSVEIRPADTAVIKNTEGEGKFKWPVLSVVFFLCAAFVALPCFTLVISKKHSHQVEEKKLTLGHFSRSLQEKTAGCSCKMHKRSQKRANDGTFLSKIM